MGNITTTGLSSYPTTLDTSTTLINGPAGDQIIAENVNGPTQAVIALETELGTLPKGTMADVKTRLAVALNNDGTLKSSVITGAVVTYVSGVFTIGSTAFDQMGLIGNMTFTATVGANALTFALKTKALSDPTATDIITIGFRAAALTTGSYLARQVTSALSVVVPSGQALGTLNATPARIYLCAIDNAGTVELAVWNPLSSGNALLQAIDETNVVNTTAIAAAPNAQQLYSTTARTGVAVRVIGFVEIQEAVAGTWATAPTVLQIMGVGTPRTNDVVQMVYTTTSAFATGATATPNDDTPPLSTEGDQYMSLALTPTNAINRLQVTALGYFSASAANENFAWACFQNASTSAVFVGTGVTPGANQVPTPALIEFEMNAATTTAAGGTFKMRYGHVTGSTNTFNGYSSARIYGGTIASYMRIKEIFV